MKGIRFLGLFLLWITMLKAHPQGIIIQPGAYVTVQNGARVLITGSSGLNIKSSETGTGSLVDFNQAGGISVQDNSNNKLERFLPMNRWSYFCPPVNNSVAAPLNGLFVKYYNEPLHNWQYILSPDTLLSLRGYAIWASNASTTRTFTGEIVNEDTQFDLSRSLDGVDYDGWNLAGNPFLSPVDWDVASGWTKTNVDDGIYYWNGTQYASYVDGIGTNGGTSVIPAMQGYFVHVNTSSASGTIVVKNSARLHSSAHFFKESAGSSLVRLGVSINSDSDELVIRTKEASGNNFDSSYDTYKLFGSEGPQIFSISPDQTQLAINSIPAFTQDLIIPVGLYIMTEGIHTIAATGLTLDPGIKVYLEDKAESHSQDLTQNPEYFFTAVPGELEGRFSLRFRQVPFGIEDPVTENILRAWYANGRLFVNVEANDAGVGSIEIYDMLGRKIYTESMPGSNLSDFALTLVQGYYIVKYTSARLTGTEKVYVR